MEVLSREQMSKIETIKVYCVMSASMGIADFAMVYNAHMSA